MKKMRLKPVVPAILLAALLPMLHSCLDNDDNYYIVYNAPNAIVTVKPIDNGAFYMHSTTVRPCYRSIWRNRLMVIRSYEL